MQKFPVMEPEVIRKAFMVLEKKNKKEKERTEMEHKKKQISYMVKILENLQKDEKQLKSGSVDRKKFDWSATRQFHSI
jgi:hypothetical protein